MKEQDFKTIWQVPKYLPFVQPDLTDEMLAQAEKQIGYKLPEIYTDLLRIQNGGYIRFNLPGFYNALIYGIGPYYPTITDNDWSDLQEYVSYELEGLVPFDSDGHCFICFDYRNNPNEPGVTYIDTESDSEETIASSFKAYLERLEIDTEDEFVIETDEEHHKFVSTMSDTLGLKFEDPDTDAHGYPVYRTQFNDHWLWISPNNVPAAFIREDEERYEELRSIMHANALRFPELPANALLMTLYEENRDEVMDRLNKNGMKVKSLREWLSK